MKNVGPIRHCKPPHAIILHCHSPGVATVACCLRIDVHDDDNNETRDRGDRYGPMTAWFCALRRKVHNCIGLYVCFAWVKCKRAQWSAEAKPESFIHAAVPFNWSSLQYSSEWWRASDGGEWRNDGVHQTQVDAWSEEALRGRQVRRTERPQLPAARRSAATTLHVDPRRPQRSFLCYLLARSPPPTAITPPTAGERSIAMSLSVCLSASMYRVAQKIG